MVRQPDTFRSPSPSTAFSHGLSVWETIEHHQQFMNNKAEYQPMLDGITAMFDLPQITMIHIKTPVEPYAALEAPVLEVATCSLHPGRTIRELETILNQLVDLANADKSPVSPVLATSGRIVESDHTVIFLMGWPSDQVHLLRILPANQIIHISRTRFRLTPCGSKPRRKQSNSLTSFTRLQTSIRLIPCRRCTTRNNEMYSCSEHCLLASCAIPLHGTNASTVPRRAKNQAQVLFCSAGNKVL